MKKKLLMLLSILVLSSSIGMAYSKPASNTELSNAIRLYKAGNYSECYTKLNTIINRGSSNALAYYYMAMTSAQIGKKNEALANYEKAIRLSNPNSNLNKYATKGKTCLESPDKCHAVSSSSAIEDLIYNKRKGVTDEVRSDYERLKIENMMREINRSEDIDPQRFKEYKDFSSYNNEGTPSNDEIVAALRTLQRAGFGNIANNGISDISLLIGGNNNYNSNAMLNMLGNSSLSPQVIQAMLTNNMGF